MMGWGWENVAVGARTMTLGGDGALYVGGGDGCVRRRAGGRRREVPSGSGATTRS